MRRLTVALFLLIAVAGGIVLLTRLGVEASPATYTVSSTADPGDGTCDGTECTLREAIAAANANVGTDTIEFDIAGAGPHTISPGSELPWITDPVIIDGTSEPDFAGSPIVELDGTSAGVACGLRIAAGSSTVKGLVINRFHGSGIEVLGGLGGNVVQGNYIGTDVTGTASLGNGGNGVYLPGTPSNTIGGTTPAEGNVISGNEGYGVRISSATGNQVQGNLIGTDVTGTAALGNSESGVLVENASGSTIGGTAAGAGNVISGNDHSGVSLGSGATGNLVQGNYIGTDVNGTAALGNSLYGAKIGEGASNNTIGGTTAAERNVISGNRWGFYIWGAGNVVQGNYVGTDKDGTADLGNLLGGVTITGSTNTIGGTAAGAGNVIAFNDRDGVKTDGYYYDPTGNTIRGNSIHSNDLRGIQNTNGGNMELAPPVIDSIGSVSGHTDPKCYPCTVEVFSDDEDEGRIYHGSTTTNDDATGTWTYPGAVTGPNITATITDASGNTSEFSAPVAYSPPAVGGIAELADASGSSGDMMIAVAGLAAPAVVILILSASYARRWWVR